MKDAYSFDRIRRLPRPATRSWPRPTCRIFDRFGLSYRAVAADSGAIGGDLSEEFQVIAATGEDAIVYCPRVTMRPTWKGRGLGAPGTASCGSRCHCKGADARQEPPVQTWPSCWVSLAHNGQVVIGAGHRRDQRPRRDRPLTGLVAAACGDHDMNEIKVSKVQGLDAGFRFATVAEIEAHFGCKPGYLGPIGLKLPAVKVIADRRSGRHG